ncbi:VOC family protein [Pedobacter montanisoli]|uniref:VOC family protein n=1 Tax=Pedobacter montanisoli TaxID=2923277 RepID=A0ABS9ZWF8_9SPHI|nr:VOC family protein [Pedobacter montanisoli]MCJ0742636.1 VOC family protein [Pedobacter montanisoli]
MATVNVYLTFEGTCEAAFNFYKSVFGGEFAHIGKFKDIPPSENMPPVAGADADKIMHVSLPISKETVLMGSDTAGEWSGTLTVGNNFAVSINAESKAEADKLFNGLSAGGKITMPMANTFWGAYFGMFTDKFGISWMVNFDEMPQK